jgi:hypothetical protein
MEKIATQEVFVCLKKTGPPLENGGPVKLHEKKSTHNPWLILSEEQILRKKIRTACKMHGQCYLVITQKLS